MAKRKKQRPRTEENRAAREGTRPTGTEPVKRPLLLARILSVLVLFLGVVMLILGGGVAAGRITEGWGFPMSAVPNWGRPWGAVLMLAAAAYVACPILLFVRPRSGSIAMLIASSLSVLVGTPLITTTTEIFYNLFQETKSRPDWVDSVWGYYIIVNVAIAIAVYRAYPTSSGEAKAARAE